MYCLLDGPDSQCNASHRSGEPDSEERSEDCHCSEFVTWYPSPGSCFFSNFVLAAKNCFDRERERVFSN